MTIRVFPQDKSSFTSSNFIYQSLDKQNYRGQLLRYSFAIIDSIIKKTIQSIFMCLEPGTYKRVWCDHQITGNTASRIRGELFR
jgi:hypothetical protein